MALINCPECDTQVSNRADKCPQCAYPINIKIEVVKTTENKEGCFLQTLNTGCAIVFIIIGLIILIAILP
jgi:hypothetical protein